MTNEATQDKRIYQFFTRGLHDNWSVIFLTQNLFHKKHKVISPNSDYIVIFKNLRDKTRFTNLARQFMPWKYKFLLWAFEDTTKLTRSYLLLDMRPEVYDRYRICGRIFNDANHPQGAYIPTCKYITCDKLIRIHMTVMTVSTWQAVCWSNLTISNCHTSARLHKERSY